MGTPAVIAVRRDTHWHGTYVGYDGGLDFLGGKLLSLVRELGGDLDAAWSRIVSAPDGWRHAFSEPYESGFNVEWFATGRTEPPLLSDEDSFVRQNVVYWYIFDLEARALDIHEVSHGGPDGSDWPLVDRILFSSDGQSRSDDSAAIRQARKARAHQQSGDHAPHSLPIDAGVEGMSAQYRDMLEVDDAPDAVRAGATAKKLDAILLEHLPLAGLRTALAVKPMKAELKTTLSREGYVCPFWLYINGAADPEQATNIYEHPTFLLFPRRLMLDSARCESALRTALEVIAREIDLDKVTLPTFDDSDEIFRALFPFRNLDESLDEAAQAGVLESLITRAFTFVEV